MESPFPTRPTVDPRLRVLYLAVLAVGIFFLRQPAWVGAACAAQALLWVWVGLPVPRLFRSVGKLWFFAAFIVASYALTATSDPDADRWIHLEIAGRALPVNLNLSGALAGVTMVLRLVTVVLASQVARAGDVRAFGQGLRKLHAPATVAASIDITLALFGERGGGNGRGGGGGGGGGGGRGRGANAPGDARGWAAFIAAVKRVASTRQLANGLERRIEDAEDYVERAGLDPAAAKRARDIAVVAGSALAMLGVRALKVLPSLPFAPGHKLVLLTPLYITASLATRTPFGSTTTGATMGTISFLMGDGRYGVFEVAKHVAPGALCDLLVPMVTAGGRRPGAATWAVFGGVIAVGRYGTILAIALVAGVPAMGLALLLPGLAVHVTFGVISGYLTVPIVQAMDQWRDERVAREIEDGGAGAPAAVAEDRTRAE